MARGKHTIVFLPFPKLTPGDDDWGAPVVLDHQVMGRIARQLEWEQTYSPRTGAGFRNPKVRRYEVDLDWDPVTTPPDFETLVEARRYAKEVAERHAEEALAQPPRWRQLDSKQSAALLKHDAKEPFLRETDRSELLTKVVRSR